MIYSPEPEILKKRDGKLREYRPLPRGPLQYGREFIEAQGVLVLGYRKIDAGLRAIVGWVRPSHCLAASIQAFHHQKKQSCRFVRIDQQEIDRELSDWMISDCSRSARHGETSEGDQGRSEELLNSLLTEAIISRVRDMHFEKLYAGGRIRICTPGIGTKNSRLDEQVFRNLVIHTKARTGLNLLDSHSPQEGSFSHCYRGNETYIRVSTIPAFSGESVSLRLLNPEYNKASLRTLGFNDTVSTAMIHLCRSNPGLFVFSGTTGSGKTTGMHALLRALEPANHRIVSLEDPVEIINPEIEQIEVNSRRKLGFGEIFRRVLRRCPDFIAIGEIRDRSSATLAVRAAMTGHTVISTIHSGSPEEIPHRLAGLGAELTQIRQSLVAAVGVSLGWQNDSSELKTRLIRFRRQIKTSPGGVGC